MTQHDSDDDAPATEPVSESGDEADDFETATAETVADAYKRLGIDPSELVRGFTRSIGAKVGDLGTLGSGFRIPSARPGESLRSRWLEGGPQPIEMPPMPDYDFSEAPPQRTAEATEKMVTILQDVHLVTADLVRLTNANLQLTERQQASARRTERFTRGMTWASLAVAVASLAVAVVAIFT